MQVLDHHAKAIDEHVRVLMESGVDREKAVETALKYAAEAKRRWREAKRIKVIQRV